MTKPIEKMTAREMNIALALFMGWHHWSDLDDDYDGPFPMFAAWDDDVSTIAVYEDEASGDVTRYWCPTAEIADAFEMETEIAHRDLAHQYAAELGMLIEIRTNRQTRFDLIHASPLDRCRAALAAVKGEGDGK